MQDLPLVPGWFRGHGFTQSPSFIAGPQSRLSRQHPLRFSLRNPLRSLRGPFGNMWFQGYISC